MAPERNPTETSPLLGEQSNALPPSTGAIPRIQGSDAVQAEQQPGGDEEPQAKNVPLRYIVPAVSIGVCILFFLAEMEALTRISGLSFCGRPDYHYGQLWANWE